MSASEEPKSQENKLVIQQEEWEIRQNDMWRAKRMMMLANGERRIAEMMIQHRMQHVQDDNSTLAEWERSVVERSDEIYKKLYGQANGSSMVSTGFQD